MEPTPPIDERLTGFGRAVRTRRLELGWSQERLAHAAGLEQSYISGLESGARNPTLRIVFRVSDALMTPTSVLVAPY